MDKLLIFVDRLADSRGTVISIGLTLANKNANEFSPNASLKRKFVPHIHLRWLADCLRLLETISGISAVTMNKWMDGAVRIWKCPSGFGSVAVPLKRYLARELDTFSGSFIHMSTLTFVLD